MKEKSRTENKPKPLDNDKAAIIIQRFWRKRKEKSIIPSKSAETEETGLENDLDLTPNFVNTFFSYIESLTDKPSEIKLEDKKEDGTTNSAATPDYSDPSVFNNTDLPPGWEEHTSTSNDPGKKYYSNSSTGETTWERPTNSSSEGDVSEGWTKHVSTSSDPGTYYYRNEKTGDVQWDRPGEAKKEGDSEKKEGDSEKKEGDSEKKEGDSEKKEGDSEKKEGDSEKKEGDSEKKEGDSYELPPGWTAHVSENSRPGETYYYNEKTDETVWEKPSMPDSSENVDNSSSSPSSPIGATHAVVPNECYKCKSKKNLKLKTYKLEKDRAVPVHFCSFKCFEGVEF